MNLAPRSSFAACDKGFVPMEAQTAAARDLLATNLPQARASIVALWRSTCNGATPAMFNAEDLLDWLMPGGAQLQGQQG